MPVVTIALIAISVVALRLDWSPDLAAAWWPWAAVASLFVGGGLIELVVNMLFLWLFAKSLEDTLGPVRFLALFLAGGSAAAGAQELVDPDTVVPVGRGRGLDRGADRRLRAPLSRARGSSAGC